MITKSKLPFVIAMADDEDPEIHRAVVNDLRNYGPSLEKDLFDLEVFLAPEINNLLAPIFSENRKAWFKQYWFKALNLEDERMQLETAMSLIVQFQFGLNYHARLGLLLNDLAKEFMLKYPSGNAFELSHFLFEYKKLKGVDKSDYYNPLNSNLVYVLENKAGIPISLALIYILIGNRINLQIEGCNFPGHFLAKTYRNNELILVDCHNGGKLIFERDLPLVADDSLESISKIIRMKTSSLQITRRVLQNLINAYGQSQDTQNSQFFAGILNSTPKI